MDSIFGTEDDRGGDGNVGNQAEGGGQLTD